MRGGDRMTGPESRPRRQGPLSGIVSCPLRTTLPGIMSRISLGCSALTLSRSSSPASAMRCAARASPAPGQQAAEQAQHRRQPLFPCRTGVLLSLSEHVDVVFSNLKSQSLQRFGLTFDKFIEHNATVVYTTLSGFGHDDVVAGGPSAGSAGVRCHRARHGGNTVPLPRAR